MSFGRTLLLEILGLLLVCLTVTAAYIRPSTRLWAKGSGGFGTSPATKKGVQAKGFVKRAVDVPTVRPPQPAPVQPQQTARAPSAAEVMARTNEAVQARFRHIAASDPALSEALELHKWLVSWEQRRAGLGLLELAGLPDGVLREADSKAARLQALRSKHPHLTTTLLHNTFQAVTWDAAAETRAERHDTQLSCLAASTQAFMGQLAAAALPPAAASSAGPSSRTEQQEWRVLDVGCGDGVLLNWLLEQQRPGGPRLKYVGVDLSAEMVRHAADRWATTGSSSGRQGGATCRFLAEDFMALTSEQAGLALADPPMTLGRAPRSSSSLPAGGDGSSSSSSAGVFDVVVLNEALHYMLDQPAALRHALSLLRPDSAAARIVVAHPKGLSSVRRQHAASPLLVPGTMPASEQDLQALLLPPHDGDGDGQQLRVVQAPWIGDGRGRTTTSSSDGGYLLVLERGGSA